MLGEGANSRVYRFGAKWLQAHLSGWFFPYFLLGGTICMGYGVISTGLLDLQHLKTVAGLPRWPTAEKET